MRKLVTTFTAFLLSTSIFAQGTLIFNNRTPTGDAPVSLPDGTGAGNLPNVVAQLFLVPSGGGAPVALTPTTTFRTSSEQAKFFINEINPFEVNGILPGHPATVRMRVFQGTSFDAARLSGQFFAESNDVFIQQLGGRLANGDTLPPASLSGLQMGVILTPTLLRFHSFSIEGDELRFGISAVMPQPNFLLEASQNTVSWQPIFTNPPSTLSLPYDPTSAPMRFFRMRTITQTVSPWGTLNFNNRTQMGDAPIGAPDGTGAGNLPGVVAQLYRVTNNGLIPLTPTTTFRTTSEAAKFFIVAINPFFVEGVFPGQPVTVRLRVYQGTSFEDAMANGMFWGESNDVTIPQLGGTLEDGTTIPTPDLNGLQGFVRI